MKRRWLYIFISLFVGILYGAKEEDIIAHMENLMRGVTSRGIYEMTIVRPTYKRSFRMRFWDKRGEEDKALIVILAPERDKGTVFLKIGYNLWMYIPKVEKTIRMPPSMMLNPWMGSDFTNDDIVKGASISRNYNKKILERTVEEKDTVYTIELIPKEDAPVVWGKVLYRVRLPGYIPIRASFYSERGEHIRDIIFRDVKKMYDRTIPTELTVVPVKEEDKRTVLRLVDVVYNIGIPDEIFTLKELERWKR